MIDPFLGDSSTSSVYRGQLRELPEREVLRRIHEEGDQAAREELITRYLPLVRSLARRFASRGQAVEDLIQVGSHRADQGHRSVRYSSRSRALDVRDADHPR